MTSAADYVFTELDPDAPDFAERFRGMPQDVRVALEDCALFTAAAQHALWKRVLHGARAIRDFSAVPNLHIECARDHLRALRALRDKDVAETRLVADLSRVYRGQLELQMEHERQSYVIAQQAEELAHLRRRLLELCARPDEPVPGLPAVNDGAR